MMAKNKLERYGVAALVIGSIIGTYVFSRKKKGISTELDEVRQEKVDRNLVTPANETFGIVWPVLYTGAIALAIHQALPSQENNPRYARARPWLALCYVLNGVFGYFFAGSEKKYRIGAAVTTISMLPAALLLRHELASGNADTSEAERIITKVMSMYAGWLTAASAISATTLIQELGYLNDEEGARNEALVALPVTAGLGYLASKRMNDPYFLITIIAALAGIALKQKDQHPDVSKMASTLALALAGVAAPDIEELGRLNGIPGLSSLTGGGTSLPSGLLNLVGLS